MARNKPSPEAPSEPSKTRRTKTYTHRKRNKKSDANQQQQQVPVTSASGAPSSSQSNSVTSTTTTITQTSQKSGIGTGTSSNQEPVNPVAQAQSVVPQPTTAVAAANTPTPSTASSASSASSAASVTTRTSEDDYRLLLTPMFSAMTKITDHLFLTGVGGMTRKNFRKNHIDFVVNITTEAPFWEDIESMRVPLEDDVSANILPYMDMAVDRINEAIVKRNSHVLVHCVAGVSRSATIVIAYLMKHKRMDLKTAFNYCYNLRPVIRPNNGFMVQLINYENQIFNKNSVSMVDVDVDGILINVPNFFVNEHPRLVLLEVMRVKDQAKTDSRKPPLDG